MAETDEVIKFPFTFSIKAIGKDEADYRAFVIETVQVHFPELNQDEVTTRPSHGGKYLAVTVPLVAQSREQLDAIYLMISQDSRTVFML